MGQTLALVDDVDAVRVHETVLEPDEALQLTDADCGGAAKVATRRGGVFVVAQLQTHAVLRRQDGSWGFCSLRQLVTDLEVAPSLLFRLVQPRHDLVHQSLQGRVPPDAAQRLRLVHLHIADGAELARLQVAHHTAPAD